MSAQKTEESLRAKLRKLRARSYRRGRKTKVEGGVNDKYLCLLFSNMKEKKKSSLAELEMLNFVLVR